LHWPRLEQHPLREKKNYKNKKYRENHDRLGESESWTRPPSLINQPQRVPMRNLRFRQFVLAGKNRYRIYHELVQKIVACTVREPPAVTLDRRRSPGSSWSAGHVQIPQLAGRAVH